MRRFLIFCLLSAAAATAARAEMAVEVVPVYYRNAADIVGNLTKELSEGGRVVVDTGSNSLVVRDWEPNIETIKAKIRAMDVRPRRIRLSAGFVERDKVSALGSKVRWYFSTPDWSQGSLPPDVSVLSGLGGTPLGAANQLSTFNRQLILLDGDREGTIVVTQRLPDAAWFIAYGVERGAIDPGAQFGDVGAVFAVHAQVAENGRIDLSLTPRLTRIDGGSDIPFPGTHLLVPLEAGQSVVVAGNPEGGDSFGKRFLTPFATGSKGKELVMTLEAAVEQ